MIRRGTFKKNRNTWLFIGFFLLAGIAYMFTLRRYVALNVLMSSINGLIYIGLLLFWLKSLRTRLLPSKARSYLIAVALLMLFYMLVRMFNYRFSGDIVTNVRYSIYLYWMPQMMIPALFLMSCIRIRLGDTAKAKPDERLILIPAVILSLMALTNDLHSLVYIPKADFSAFKVDSGTYTWGAGLYLMFGWMLLCAVSGLEILIRITRRKSGSVIWHWVLIIALWLGLVIISLTGIKVAGLSRMYNVPEVHIFAMLAIIEVCIQHRMIPYNENYTGFFSSLQMPVIITDLNMDTVYSSGNKLPVEKSQLLSAMTDRVYLYDDLKLSGRSVRAGYAFWAEDESIVHKMQEQLMDANEMIEQENSLIEAETEQKEQAAYLQSRHHIYHEIAQQMYPCQKRIEEILEQTVPGTDGFRDKIALVSVLNVYIKRKTNMLLLASESSTLSTDELFLALGESAGYLRYAGLMTTAVKPEGSEYPAQQIIELYDSFETISEQMLGKTGSLMITWRGDGLTLAAAADCSLDLRNIALPVKLRREEGTLYVDIISRQEGGRA